LWLFETCTSAFTSRATKRTKWPAKPAVSCTANSRWRRSRRAGLSEGAQRPSGPIHAHGPMRLLPAASYRSQTGPLTQGLGSIRGRCKPTGSTRLSRGQPRSGSRHCDRSG
jgi:hypothetical protein